LSIFANFSNIYKVKITFFKKLVEVAPVTYLKYVYLVLARSFFGREVVLEAVASTLFGREAVLKAMSKAMYPCS
jgi:hypothetical protein